MPAQDMSEWYHHPVFNRYWKQFWMIKDWINERQKFHQVARRHGGYHDTNYCACRHGSSHFCHGKSSGFTDPLPTQHKHSNQCCHASRHDFNGHFCHHRCNDFPNSHHCLNPTHHERSMHSFCTYPKHHGHNSLRSPHNQPRISQNQQIHSVFKCKADVSPVMPFKCKVGASCTQSRAPVKRWYPAKSPAVPIKRKATSAVFRFKRKVKPPMLPVKYKADVSRVMQPLHEKSEVENTELEFVVTDQWMEVMKESHEFRQKRDALKKERDDEDENCAQVDKELSLQEKEDLKMAEKKIMYGDAAPKIRAMEMAMQLSFERHCKAKKPHLWPVLPLVMRFDP